MPDGIMAQRVLGSSGIRVSELCLGAMTFGTEWGFGADETESRAVYDKYRAAGGNFVDTANNYTNGASEEMLGRFIASERDAMVVSTKYTLPTDPRDANSGGSNRKSLRRSVETSLRRLGTDYLDVLWVHAWDRCTPEAETLRALDDLVRAGKVLAIGISNTPAWVISRSNAIAELRGWTSFCALQVEYSLLARTPERELLPMAEHLGLPVYAWSPLARGALARDHTDESLAALTLRMQRIVKVTREIADELGTSSARVALAWVRRQGLLLSVGARTAEQLRDNLGALSLQLSDDQLARLEEASAISAGYPHDFLSQRRAMFEPDALPSMAGALQSTGGR
ncbi:aryl-alcohol dehydrogenase-like predicted oxidoreductase [Rhodococcus rhodochrous J45]|uniref:Aryl-alcohol dehydrogenase-like predicted oxidoreductase n=1 Tax=Rhodococcus rhodochrous J45 TaxID=935266 RepID=A0A562EQC1_RHORH|nr:aldo/keto reductase [Rhodococcus rhodochrous]TWH24082.1 aryl-alcohol dehydrogenase-like predicted oxidoreductase [Rhodococcus rhodochrous J45]